jgi:hypothetical protein
VARTDQLDDGFAHAGRLAGDVDLCGLCKVSGRKLVLYQRPRFIHERPEIVRTLGAY